jgi:NAD(P)-dependent dehydrogenase (short-subunit alcohol dehydrogenase family)
MDLGLQGKRALVTGSSAGIGAAIAEALAAEGVSVVVHGRDPVRTKAVAEPDLYPHDRPVFRRCRRTAGLARRSRPRPRPRPKQYGDADGKPARTAHIRRTKRRRGAQTPNSSKMLSQPRSASGAMPSARLS